MNTSTSKTPLYIFGEVLFDCFPDSSRVLGGAPFNVAWHLRAFGLDPNLISAVGDDDMGREIKEQMQNWGLSTGLLETDPAHSTGVVNVSFNDQKEPSYVIEQNASFDFIRAKRLPTLDSDSLFYHGTLAIRNETSYTSLQKILDENHPRRFIDVNLRDPWWERDKTLRILQYADYVKLNLDELKTLGEFQPGENWIEQAHEFKAMHNIVILLITRGKDGVTLIDELDQVIEPDKPPENASFVDSVGAGDAFAAMALLGIALDWDWLTTIERAQAFASFIVSQRGATCGDSAVYEDFRTFWSI